MKKVNTEITILFGVFSLFFVLSFSFPFQVIPNIGEWFEGGYNVLVGKEVTALGWNAADFSYHSGEDSKGVVFNLLNISLLTLISYVVIVSQKSKINKDKWVSFIGVGMRYYLAIILLIYGFDKVYKWQFYSPESNILYTRVKDLPQDMLYWTTMGTSYSYSLFGGISEVIAGLLLLFRKTHVLGALFSFMVMANVFAVNIGFDVTIKLFSGFLLLLSIIILLPSIIQIANFFLGKNAQLNQEIPAYSKSKFYIPIKVVVLLLFLIECQYKYFEAWNFNDDNSAKPHFHGAYDVIDSTSDIDRVHFHRHGYLILQFEDEFFDYKVEMDEKNEVFQLADYDQNKIVLSYKEAGDTLKIFSQDSSFLLVSVKSSL